MTIEPDPADVRTPTPRGPTSVRLGADAGAEALWAEVALAVRDFLAAERVPASEAVVLLPFAQCLPLARRAWAAAVPCGWMPRFETARTLADSLAPATEPQAGAPGLDPVTDGLRAARLLADTVPDWPVRDPRGFQISVRRLVDLTHALVAARCAIPAAQRAAWAHAARDRLAAPAGPAQAERALASLALAWSLQADTGFADTLFSFEPAAWIGLRAGARDPLAETLLASARVPALWIEADRDPSALPACDLAIGECADFEDEAQRAAAAVLEQVQRLGPDDAPVALVALDRVLVRRVSALLRRQALACVDETGWKLSTTRAAARVVGLLRASAPRAATDDLLELLKALPGGAADGLQPQAVDALEAELRHRRWTDVVQVDRTQLGPRARLAWDAWAAASAPLRDAGHASLGRWLERLAQALEASALLETLGADDAGGEVLRILRIGQFLPALQPQVIPDPGFERAAREARFSAASFRGWVEDVLEQASFRPAGAARPSVVITPLQRALLRPFSAVVCPGADVAHLGANPAPEPLLGDALAVSLGLPGVDAARESERRAFAQLARAPRLLLLYRRTEGPEPLGASPLLLRWRLAAAREGRSIQAMVDPRGLRRVQARPTPRPAPSLPALLPRHYSASRYEQLRACPYRFYALSVLGLGEAEELDDELDKSEVGLWVHAVLHDFHAERTPGAGEQADLARLRAVAARQARQRFAGPAAADFLPFEAWFEALAPAYLEWLHRAEDEGWRLQAAETSMAAALPLPEGLPGDPVWIRGQLDRVDRAPAGPGSRDGADGPEGVAPGPEGGAVEDRVRLIDYKLRSRSAVSDQLGEPQEDTQLAFYAALLVAGQGRPMAGLEAGYLALDGRDGPHWLVHDDVGHSADALLRGLVDDVLRLRQGAPMPALGEGRACEHCCARGLCRRDHWGAP